jgi:hypothetical protein
MQVKFISDQTLSYDGINVKDYKAGQVYEATHAQERIVFEKAIYMGKATTFANESEPKVETKVVKPKARK